MPRPPNLRHPQGGPLGPSVRGHRFAVLSTKVRQNPPNSLEREDCNLADVRRMMSKIYTDNLACSNSNSSRGIAGRGVAMQAIGPDLSNLNCHDYNKFGHYKNDCNEFKAVNQQNQRRRRRLHKQRGGHQPHQPKPGGQQQQGGGGGGGTHTTRPPPTTTPTATPGQQTGLMATPISLESVFRAFPGSAARGISLSEMTRREALHLNLGERGPACDRAHQSPGRGGEGDPAIRLSFDSSDEGVANSPLAIYSAC